MHPFDDPVVMAGAGTVGLEILEDVPGGRHDRRRLSAGRARRRDRRRRRAARACGSSRVEPERLGRARRSALAAGEPVPVTPETVADGLDAPFAGRSPIATLPGGSASTVVLVTDEEIRGDAFRFLYADAKLACEPGGAAAVAAVLAGRSTGSTVVAVVSGGNVSAEIASAILAGP